MEVKLYCFLIVLNVIGNTFCYDKEIQQLKSICNSKDTRFKRVIEYTRWRMATRTTPDFDSIHEDDNLDIKRPISKEIETTQETENVFVADAVSQSSATAKLIDGTTVEYTRFVIPKDSDATKETYLDMGFASSVQGSGDTIPISLASSTMEENAVEVSTDIQEIVGVNQNSQNEEVQSVETSDPNSFEIVHQVAPLAPITISQELEESSPKSDLLEGQAFSPAQPPFNKPIRSSLLTDIFVPTRMYITSITEDFEDFLSLSPEQDKVSISSTHLPIELVQRPIQIHMPHLSGTTYIDDLKSDIDIKVSKASENDIQIIPNSNDKKYTIEDNTRSTIETTDLAEISVNTEVNNYETQIDNDYVDVIKLDTDKSDLVGNTIFSMNNNEPTIPTNTPTIDTENSSTLETDYIFTKDSNNYHRGIEKEEKKDSSSRLDQFYDNIYMKYEEPRQQRPIPKKNVNLDKSEYEEEDSELTQPKPSNSFAVASEIYRTITMTPYIKFLSNTNNEEGDDEEDLEEEDKGVSKVDSSNVDTTEKMTSSFTTFKFNPVTENAHEDIIAPIEGVCSLVKLTPLNFKSARTLYEINIQLQMWSQNPIVKIVDITKGNLTYLENPINMVVIDDITLSKRNVKKGIIMVVAGIYGRDHFAVTSAMYLLNQLIEKRDKSLLKRYIFWVIPVLNPDGYHYSVTFPKQREWVKNLHQYNEECLVKECESCFLRGTHCKLKICYGVNLDRNFGYQWIPAVERATDNVCNNFYAGEKSISEPESKALASFLKDDRTKLSAFITFKEGDVLGIMYPYSNTKKARTSTSNNKALALRAASAAHAVNDRVYVAGQMSVFLPLFSGSLEDWVDDNLHINNIFTIMMQTKSSNSSITMERVVGEAYVAFDSFLLRTPDIPPPPPMQLKHVNKSIPKTNNPVFMQIVLTLIFLWS